jgi:hypothetical protein
MLIVGGAAALTAIAVFFAWILVQKWLVSRRRRKAERLRASRARHGQITRRSLTDA